MEKIVVNRFKTYRTMRWYRSDYLWRPSNPYLSKYGIEVHDDASVACDVLAIPCPHLPGHEFMVHRDQGLWIQKGHLGEFDFCDAPMICDSSMDYAFVDPSIRELISHPQLRFYMPNASFRDDVVQQRRSWAGEYYGMAYKQRTIYGMGTDVREDRNPLSKEIADKIRVPRRPPTPPFSDAVFEHIARKVKPLEDREIDLFFSGRTKYSTARNPCHATLQRKHLERIWNELPGRTKVFKSYDNYDGTRKNGREIKVFKYPYEYVDVLLESKIVISPWGWASWCVRDLEALACGCVVVKPECSNTLVYPDIYDARKRLMVWCDILYDGLPEQLHYLYRNLDEMQDRADRGRKFVTDALYPNDKIYSVWTPDLREMLEASLSSTSYATSDSIPDR